MNEVISEDVNSETPEPNRASRKFSFSIASLMIVTGVVAVGIKFPMLFYYSTFVIPVLLIFLLTRAQPQWARYFWILAAIYLPSLQGFFMDGAHCRKVWPELFPVAATFMPTMLLRNILGIPRGAHFTDPLGSAAFMLVTLFCLFYFFLPRKRIGFFAALFVVSLGSVFFVNFLIAMLYV